MGNSDHVSLTFKTTLAQHQVDIPQTYNIFKSDYKAIQEKLRYQDWNGILRSNFDEDYDTFANILNTLMKQHTPLKMQAKAKRSMYLTKEAMRLKNAKRRCWTRYLTTGTDQDRRTYCHRKNKLRVLTRELKRGSQEKIFKSPGKSPG